MIVLSEFKLLQKLMGLNPLGGVENIAVRICNLYILTSCNLMFVVYLIVNIHGDIYQVLATLPPICAYTSLIATYMHLLLRRKQFYSLLDELLEIVGERARNIENETIYARTEQRTNFATKFFIYGALAISISTLCTFILAACHWCLGIYTLDSWIFFYPAWTPFKLNSTIRCASLAFYESCGATSASLLFCSVPCLLHAFVMYSRALMLDVKFQFVQLDRLSKRKASERSELEEHAPKNLEWKMIKRCREAVDLHQKVYNLDCNLSDIMNFIILETILLWTICICIALTMIVKYTGSHIIRDLHMPFGGTAFPLVIFAILFYFGQSFNSNMMELSITIYQSEWYQYPRSVQRFVLLMMQRSQRPFYFSAYGLMELHLQNYLGLLKRIYSAVMVLQRMD